MTSNNQNEGGTTWPMPKFRFQVDFGNNMSTATFHEIHGMKEEDKVDAQQPNNSPPSSPPPATSSSQPAAASQNNPGFMKYGNVTMKRGVFTNDNTFWDWHNQIKQNTIVRRTVLIKLLDESGKVTMQWQLNNAWPTKITSTDLKSDGNEVAVDTLEIAHEQLTITNGR